MNGIYRNACGTCEDCVGNGPQYCQHSLGLLGFHAHGNFAEYVIADSRMSVRLPDEVTFEQAAPLACAGITIWRAVQQAELQAGDWIALVGGGGGLGHIGIQFAHLCGLKVISIDARDEGLSLSREVGADIVLDARHGIDHVAAEVRAVTKDGKGVDATVNLSDAEGAAAMACAITKMHGLLVQMALPTEVKIPFAELIFRNLRIKSSLISSPSEASKMLDVVAKNNVRVKVNVFKGLEEVQKMIDYIESGKMQGKAVVAIDQGLK